MSCQARPDQASCHNCLLTFLGPLSMPLLPAHLHAAYPAQVVIAPWRPQLPDWEFYLANQQCVARTPKWANGSIWADRCAAVGEGGWACR